MRTVGEWGFADRFGPEIVTETSGLNAVFLGGEPLCVWWTFVRNSRDEIAQAARYWSGYVDTGAQESAERFRPRDIDSRAHRRARTHLSRHITIRRTPLERRPSGRPQQHRVPRVALT